MNIALMVISGVLLLGGLVYYIKSLIDLKKNENQHTLFKKDWMKLGGSLAIFALAGILFQVGLSLQKGWELSAGQWVLSIIGILLFVPAFAGLWGSFYLYFYKISLCKKGHEFFFKSLMVCIALSLFSFLLLGEGVASSLTYPLASGIHIGSDGFKLNTAYHSYSGGLNISFYGIVIVLGALVAYWITDHLCYRYYGEHGLIDLVFLLAFPGGIIGARIGYVMGNWNVPYGSEQLSFAQRVANGDFWCMFRIWDGGLTILGGAIAGIIVGCLVMILARKTLSLRFVMDAAIPSILLSQAIGRWGNFFNKEVYGMAVEPWSILPTWIVKQMSAGNGLMYVPLFLIEGLLNIAGYFLIRYGVGKGLKKWIHRGDLSGAYLVWYGVVRFVLERFRDASYNMGQDGSWSFIWAGVYIGIGVLFIVFNHVFDYLYYVKTKHPYKQDNWKGVYDYSAHHAFYYVEEKKSVKPVEKKATGDGEDKPVEL